MPQVVIENPVLNSPFDEPKHHFKFSDDGITDEIVEARRVSQYFIPIPRPRKRNARQLTFETEWTADRIQENEFINRVRGRVALWRQGGYTGVTSLTRRLLDYWRNPERERLKRALRAEIDEAAWSALYQTASLPFEPPATGKIAVKVINHYGDEVMRVEKI